MSQDLIRLYVALLKKKFYVHMLYDFETMDYSKGFVLYIKQNGGSFEDFCIKLEHS
jgi:hypothetical protein